MRGLVIDNVLDMLGDDKLLQWQSLDSAERKGIDMALLYDAKDQNNEGPVAALLRYFPGATAARHTHLGYELIYVLEGSLITATGTRKAGSLEVCPPGSSHHLSSAEGCILLVVWEQPVIVQNKKNKVNANEC